MSAPHTQDMEYAIREPGKPDLVIEDARFRDLRAIAHIQKHSFRPELAYRFPVLLTLWILPFVTFLVARRAATGEVVGCMIGDRTRNEVRIMNIAVHPNARRQGVGTALLHAIADRLPSGNLVLMVEEQNRGAQALYQAQGFTRSGYQRNYYGANRHGIEMTLRRGSQPAIRNGKPTSGRIRV
jgi:ribosomal-protein-alanine N-acetyltransferase